MTNWCQIKDQYNITEIDVKTSKKVSHSDSFKFDDNSIGLGALCYLGREFPDRQFLSKDRCIINNNITDFLLEKKTMSGGTHYQLRYLVHQFSDIISHFALKLH